MSNTTEDTNTVTDGFNYQVHAFEKGVESGIKYVVPQAQNLAVAVERFGEDFVLTVLNQALVIRVAQKVRSSRIPNGDNENEIVQKLAVLLEGKGNVIFDTKDAEAYRPGLREPGFNATLNDALAKVKTGELSNEDALKVLLALESKTRKKKTPSTVTSEA